MPGSGPNLSGIDPDTGKLTRLFHPRTDVWRDHFQHPENGQIIRITDVGPDHGAPARLLDLNSEIRTRIKREVLGLGEEEAIELAELLLSEGVIPKGSENDALHVGIAAAQGAFYLLTWNFRHINNAEKKAAIVKVVESRDFVCPQICSPEEVGGGSND